MHKLDEQEADLVVKALTYLSSSDQAERERVSALAERLKIKETREISITRLRAPNGSGIAGTLERIAGRADVSSVRIKPDGSLDDIDFAGWTEVFWDDQETVYRYGHPVFLDEGGQEWLFKDLIIVEGEESEE